MKTVANVQFYDSPPSKAWFLQFRCLELPTDHRKILNRQPEVKYLCVEGFMIARIVFNWKVMSN